MKVVDVLHERRASIQDATARHGIDKLQGQPAQADSQPHHQAPEGALRIGEQARVQEGEGQSSQCRSIFRSGPECQKPLGRMAF